MRTGARLALGLALALGGATREAAACAVCSVGDPTLTTLGTEKPYRNRLRAALGVQHRTDAIGQPRVNRLLLSEQRLDLTLAWAPHERVFLSLVVPALRREITYVNLARKQTVGPGDTELRGRVFLWQDREWSARHLVSLTGGVKLPSAPVQCGRDGERLPLELQPGTGSVDPLGGLSYAFFAFPWSAYASALLTWPTRGPEGSRASRSLRATVAGQRQLSEAFALRLGLDGRLDGRAIEEGAPEADSGGFIGYVSPELVVSPGVDLMLSAVVRVPVLDRLKGFHDEGVIVGLTAAKDF